MSRSLKETNFHGTPMFPLQIYSHKDKNGFYSVTAHWHEELEFLYIEAVSYTHLRAHET